LKGHALPNDLPTRWSAEAANAWYAKQDWPCGFNFLPSTAVNFVDMWHPETFDATTIDRELGWAAAMGYNSARVNIQFVLWQADRKGLLARLDQYLAISTRHGISTAFCLFDDCEFSGGNPSTMRQPDPIPGVHNSRALGSPGRRALLDLTLWPVFEAYVTDILSTFRQDPRVLYWDLYNEPCNLSLFTAVDAVPEQGELLQQRGFQLCKDAFLWARAVTPMQPITSGAWMLSYGWLKGEPFPKPFLNEVDQFLLTASDIITYHGYVPMALMTGILTDLQALGRPVMCTEWLARPVGSLMSEQLPLFARHKVGSYHWGFANGRTQTHIPWPVIKAGFTDYDPVCSPWFHDVVYADGKPYDAAEADLIKHLVGKA
jgi:hypothetical protein